MSSINHEVNLFEPLQFEPILKRKCWGGRRLAERLHKQLEEHDDYGECIEICDLIQEQTHVARGYFQHWSLHQLVQEQREFLFGKQHFNQFPLIVKWIDAKDRLSLQVHPTDQHARDHGSSQGKHEAWVIVDCEPDSYLYAGLKKPYGRNTVEQALKQGTIEELLHRIPVSSGDCFYIPAGTIHAIGAGILIAEVQQPCDITFRLHDWNRKDRTGNPRPLQIEEALHVATFPQGPIQRVIPTIIQEQHSLKEELLNTNHFTIIRHTIQKKRTFETNNTFRILMTISGEGILTTQQPETTPMIQLIDTIPTLLSSGTTHLIPASIKSFSTNHH